MDLIRVIKYKISHKYITQEAHQGSKVDNYNDRDIPLKGVPVVVILKEEKHRKINDNIGIFLTARNVQSKNLCEVLGADLILIIRGS